MKFKINETLRGFIEKEIKQTLRDPRMRILLFVAPVMQLTIFGIALSNDVKNVRLAAQYQPSDTWMQSLYDQSIASGWFIPAKTEGVDPFKWVQSGQADAVLVAPKETMPRARERGQGELQLLVNAQNVIRAQAVENYILAIARTLEQGSGGARAPLLRLFVRPLYNPTLETSVYLVPGVMCMLVCMVTIILTAMSIAREREIGTLETLIAAPVYPWEVILGKTVPFVMIGCIQLPLILSVGVFGFGIPFRGPVILLVAAALLFIITTVSIGLVISSFARNQQQAMLGGFLFLFPAVLLSGLLFPLESMPTPVYLVAQLNPLTHFIALLRNILLKGGDLRFFAIHAIPIAAIGALSLFTGLRKFHTTLS